jgi:general secretion pathway protein C
MGLQERLDALLDWMHERQRWLARGGALAAGILVGGLALWVSGIGHLAWKEHPKPAVTQSLPPVVPAPPMVKNISGEVTQGRLGTDSSISKVPLRLHLMQTIPGVNAHSGRALLGVDPEHPQTYLAGAILENGSRLREIYPDHVVLVRGSERTSLFVEHPGADPRQSTGADSLAMVGEVAAPQAPETPRLSVEPVTDYLRAVPTYENGLVMGFQLYPGKQATLFRQWGLQPGDVLTALNGQPVSDPDQLMQTLRGLSEGAPSLEATVQRNGDTVSVVLDGADVQRLAAASTPAVLPPPNPPP